MTDEWEWKPVDGWPYEVSAAGHVRRVGAACGTKPGLILKPCNGGGGYLCVTLSANNKQRTGSIHHLICTAFHGNRPEGCEVRHLDGNRTNNNKDNLAWGTAKENAADRARHGNKMEGDKHPRTKVSEADYLSILNQWDIHPRGQGQTAKFAAKIMAEHGVSLGFVEDAIYGRIRAARIRRAQQEPAR